MKLSSTIEASGDPQTTQPPTRERILEAGLRLFNEHGYAATPVAEIAKTVGISTGNLTYHFPAKLDIVTELSRRSRLQYRELHARPRSGPIADTYVEAVRFAMNHAWDYRFLLHGRAQFRESRSAGRPNPDGAADIALTHDLLQRVQSAGMFHNNPALDLLVLARSVWIVSRFWMDHLSEAEGLMEVTWADQERGLQHHIALLSPCLNAAGRREFEAALERLASRHETSGEHHQGNETS